MEYTVENFIKNVLILNGKLWTSHNIKLKLFNLGIKEHKCEKCGQGEIWFGETLSLHLDHKNGNHRDNRLENLVILCPNCHSQTLTYAGKRHKRGRKKYNESQNKKCDCGKLITNNAIQCSDCYHKRLRKIERPLHEQLQNEINKMGYTETGKKYNVSDNTIRKWIKHGVVAKLANAPALHAGD